MIVVSGRLAHEPKSLQEDRLIRVVFSLKTQICQQSSPDLWLLAAVSSTGETQSECNLEIYKLQLQLPSKMIKLEFGGVNLASNLTMS